MGQPAFERSRSTGATFVQNFFRTYPLYSSYFRSESALSFRTRRNRSLAIEQRTRTTPTSRDTFFSIDYGRIVAFITQKGVPTSVHHFIQLFEGHDAAVP